VTRPDPFATADLRRVVLDGWAASVARFREDANAEDLLAAGGYAGRALVELAANGVDAARDQGVPARLRIRLIDGELRLANTGTPLTAAGVAGLASLRASAKRDGAGSVGFFGVGFTAVLSWTSAPRVISTTGGIRFDGSVTRDAVRGLSTDVDTELRRRDGHVPVLRLPWPTDPAEEPPPSGFTTEVRLPLTGAAHTEVTDLLADPATVEDLLWALPELTEIDLPDRVIRRSCRPDGVVVIDDGGRAAAYRVITRSGDLPADLLAGRPVEQRGRTRWSVSWIRPLPADPVDPMDVLRGSDAPTYTVGAPTPTDEPLTLPARLVATLPVDDTRRRLAPGPLCDYLLERAADTYLDLVLATDADERWRLLPSAGFPAGPVDGELRAAIVRRAESTPLLRTAVGDWVTPGQACVLPGLDTEGAAAIGQAIPGLLAPIPPAALAVLRPLGTATLGWSQVSAALAGLDRPPTFWWEVYRAAADADPRPRPDDLADIPVPLVGGRRAVGARGCLLPAEPTAAGGIGGADGIGRELARRLGATVPDLRVVHPDAAHPLLTRLGAAPAEPSAVLADPALADRVGTLRRELDDVDVEPDEVRSVAGVVLDLIAAGGEPDSGVLADLVLTDEDGNPWPAAELLVPGAALAGLLDPDVDRVLVEPGWLDRYGPDLLVRAAVRDGIPIVTVADPLPDSLADRLPDLDVWVEFGSVDGEFRALADLDLIDEDRWPQALALIANDPQARECLQPTAVGPSYSGWWIGRHALVGGRPPGHWRLPDAADLAGLYDPLPIDLDAGSARWIGVRTDLASAAADDPTGLLERLVDPDRAIAPARVPGLTAAVIAALGASDIDLPDEVRTLTGAVVDAESAAVLDQPWWVQVEDVGRLVPGGVDPPAVARVLDLPLVSALGSGPVGASGPAPDAADDRWRRAAAAVGLDPEAVWLTVAESLTVTVTGRDAAPVRWWGTDGRFASDGSAESLGRVAAWAAGRWSLRHLAVAAAAQDESGLAESGIG
jgi:hypothetical protein